MMYVIRSIHVTYLRAAATFLVPKLVEILQGRILLTATGMDRRSRQQLIRTKTPLILKSFSNGTTLSRSLFRLQMNLPFQTGPTAALTREKSRTAPGTNRYKKHQNNGIS